jgi:hypothetical protein
MKLAIDTLMSGTHVLAELAESDGLSLKTRQLRMEVWLKLTVSVIFNLVESLP